MARKSLFFLQNAWLLQYFYFPWRRAQLNYCDEYPDVIQTGQDVRDYLTNEPGDFEYWLSLVDALASGYEMPLEQLYTHPAFMCVASKTGAVFIKSNWHSYKENCSLFV